MRVFHWFVMEYILKIVIVLFVFISVHGGTEGVPSSATPDLCYHLSLNELPRRQLYVVIFNLAHHSHTKWLYILDIFYLDSEFSCHILHFALISTIFVRVLSRLLVHTIWFFLSFCDKWFCNIIFPCMLQELFVRLLVSLFFVPSIFRFFPSWTFVVKSYPCVHLGDLILFRVIPELWQKCFSSHHMHVLPADRWLLWRMPVRFPH